MSSMQLSFMQQLISSGRRWLAGSGLMLACSLAAAAPIPLAWDDNNPGNGSEAVS